MTIDSETHNIPHATVLTIVQTLTAGTGQVDVLGLHGSCGAHLLAQLMESERRTLLVVVPDQRQARTLFEELRFYSGSDNTVWYLPHWEMRPYEALTPHAEVEATRLEALAALASGRAKVVVLPVRALLQRVIPWEVLAELSESLVVGEDYPRQPLLKRLQELGYQPVALVEDRGSFSARGDIVDLFPPTGDRPLRLDFFGDTLEKIRSFDPGTQRSAEGSFKTFDLQPAREMVLAGRHLDTFLANLKERCDDLGLPRSVREEVAEEAREGLLAPGRCFLLPLNYGRLDSLFDYAGNARWVLQDPGGIEREVDSFSAEIQHG